MTDLILSVSQLNKFAKATIESNELLQSVFVTGEISNFVDHYKSGHFYFTLKDNDASVKAVMFRTYAQSVPFTPENGMRVICRVRVSIYERDGQFQLYVEQMQPDGIGALKIAFDQLTAKLRQEGLFDEAHKKKLPFCPSRVAIITSPTGAAVQDITSIIARRMPATEIVMCPVLVQGEDAPEQLTKAVNDVNRLDCADVIIIGRGGGSIEDLWAFNNEQLAYEIFRSEIPIISAVGHETDFTICDYVADVRAATPSAAAELAVPDKEELDSYLDSIRNSLLMHTRAVLSQAEQKLFSIKENAVLKSPQAYIDRQYECFDKICKDFLGAARSIADTHSAGLSVLAAKLDAFSPLKTISRGYTIAYNNGEIIRTVSEVSVDDKINLRLSDGRVNCTVDSIERINS